MYWKDFFVYSTYYKVVQKSDELLPNDAVAL